jgi:hypothetical protein
LQNLARIVRHEMNDKNFMYIPTERAVYYREPLKHWESVAEKFPETVVDIEESSKCFACDRYAGAVFHAMLVAESGVIKIGKLIEMEDFKIGWSGPHF